ncbi:hypothetical protein EON64_16410 [archaeon]|nr:MAG: hypothetical protein EON64_16410 [archaeon]
MVLFKGPGPLPQVATKFSALLMTLLVAGQSPLICGHVLQLYVQGVEVQCRLSRIVSVAGSTSKAPKSLPGGRSGVVHLEVQGSVLLEPFAACRALGRFALRSKGFTVAVGTVEEIL